MTGPAPNRPAAYLRDIGVPALPPCTSPFDPGYDQSILEGHLEQSAHLMASLKLSMACWMVASEAISRRKLAAARVRGVATVAGGGSFEVPLGRDGCRPTSTSAPTWGSPTSRPARGSPTSPSIQRRSCGWPANATSSCSSSSVASTADRLPRRRSRPWSRTATAGWTPGRSSWWSRRARAPAGSTCSTSEGRCPQLADPLAASFGLPRVVLQASTKASQFALLDHFGRQVRLGNVGLEEHLRLKIYRRGLHADAFAKTGLRPAATASGLGPAGRDG